MSLIEEALRRLKDPALPTQPSPTAPKPEPDNAPAARSWSAISRRTAHSAASSQPQTTNAFVAVTVAVIALTAAFIAGSVFWMDRTLGQHRTAPPVPALPQPAPPPDPVPTPQSTMSALPEPPPASPAPSEPTPAPSPIPAPAPKEEVVLTGIVEGSGQPYAVINGSIVGVGEQIQGLTLLKIGRGAVTGRRDDGSETTLSLPK